MAHAYVSFRIRLARHALRQLAASLRGSSEIVLVMFAPVLVGLLALAALPPLYAATLALPQACALVLAHALAMASPVLLLRQRLMPHDVVEWTRALPVPRRVRLSAHTMVAWMVAQPLAVLYATSLAIWIGQRPAWIEPVGGVLATLVSFALSVSGVVLILALHTRPARIRPRFMRPARPYTQPRIAMPTLFMWRRLYWNGLWRRAGAPGLLIAGLFAASIVCAWTWMHRVSTLPPAGMALAYSIGFVLLADRSDKARREQDDLLRPLLAARPTEPRALARLAQCLGALPGLVAIASLWILGSAGTAWHHTAGRWYLGLALLAQLSLVAVPMFSARGRAGAVALSILVLAAVGGEIWQ